MKHLNSKCFDLQFLAKIVLIVAWISASCGGIALLELYANSAGTTLKAPGHWPAESHLPLSEQSATLVLFAHPRCPCTRATLGELERIVARFHGSFTPWVVFLKPEGVAEDWDQTGLRRMAEAIPSVQIVSDRGGNLARQFQATTSGETFLYSNSGELLYQGGITASRGHAGENTGRTAIETCLAHSTPQCRQTPVFGCPIALPCNPLKATK
jgi:hypothetical protein